MNLAFKTVPTVSNQACLLFLASNEGMHLLYDGVLKASHFDVCTMLLSILLFTYALFDEKLEDIFLPK